MDEHQNERRKADIDPTDCIKCGHCYERCPYGAIALSADEEPSVIEALCKGCGLCAADCPTESINMLQFSDEQIMARIDEPWHGGRRMSVHSHDACNFHNHAIRSLIKRLSACGGATIRHLARFLDRAHRSSGVRQVAWPSVRTRDTCRQSRRGASHAGHRMHHDQRSASFRHRCIVDSRHVSGGIRLPVDSRTGAVDDDHGSKRSSVHDFSNRRAGERLWRLDDVERFAVRGSSTLRS